MNNKVINKRLPNMRYHFYLNSKLYYMTFKGYCYVVEFNLLNNKSKTTRISFSYFEGLHAEKYGY